MSQPHVVGSGCGGAPHIDVGLQRLRALDASVTYLQRPILRRVVRQSQRLGVKRAGLDSVAILVRLPAMEKRALDLEVAAHVAQRHHAVRDVRGIEPVVRDRSFRVVDAREPMHEGGRAERGLSRKPCVNEHRVAFAHGDAVARRHFHEEVVGVLAVDERSAPVRGLSGLQ